MRWDLILPQLGILLGKLTGLSQIAEGDSPQKVINPQKKAQLSYRVTSCTGLGADEWRYTTDADPNQLDITVCGTRVFTLSVKCEGYEHNNASAAYQYLERIYTRLSRLSSRQFCTALGVAWVDAGPTLNLSKNPGAEDRVFSIGQKDFMFTAVVNELDDDPADYPTTTISTVQLYSSTLNDVNGTPLGKQISFTGPP